MSMTTENFIVAGVDGSAASAAACMWAAGEANRRGAQLRLVHAYSVPVAGFAGPGMVPPDIYEESRDYAKSVLTDAGQAALAAYPDLTVTTLLVHDSPLVALRKAAEHALLTVVGSHGSNQFKDSVLGSVAARLAAHSHGPVVVIRTDPLGGTPSGSGPVVVGLDGSPDSAAALAFAFEEASLREVALYAIHTWDAEPLDGFQRAYPLELDRDRIDAEEERVLAEQLAGWSEKYPDVEVRQIVLRGRPTATLLHALRNPGQAGEPSLAVVGSRGRGGFRGLLLGSVSQALIAHAPCPVAVVRPHAGR